MKEIWPASRWGVAVRPIRLNHLQRYTFVARSFRAFTTFSVLEALEKEGGGLEKWLRKICAAHETCFGVFISYCESYYRFKSIQAELRWLLGLMCFQKAFTEQIFQGLGGLLLFFFLPSSPPLQLIRVRAVLLPINDSYRPICFAYAP